MTTHDSLQRPPDQAQRLRELVSDPVAVPRFSQAHATHVIAVVSGKGGVGKTLLSANLSIALTAHGHRVVLLDMDLGLANADIVLGLETTSTMWDVLAGRRKLEEVLLHGPGHIDFVPGASGVASMADLSEFERHQLAAAIQRIESQYDVVVLDCGAGISRGVVGFGHLADTILVLSTPEPTSVTDAYATMKAFAQDPAGGIYARSPAGAIGVVVNLAESRREGRDTYERLAGVAARFLHLPITDYGYILRDEHVGAAIRERCPVILHYPRCPASTCIMATAARLSREMGQPQEGESLFYRVVNMFL